MCANFRYKRLYSVNYRIAMSMDMMFRTLGNTASWSPGMLLRYAYLFKAKVTHDPDTPNIREALNGEYREEFIKAMGLEIPEFEGHETWMIIKQSDILKVTDKKGNQVTPLVIPTILVFKIKRLPDGALNKIKARFCVQGDLQTDGVDAFETYAPVASWNSICMLSIISLQNGWVTKQIDFSNAFVQAPLDKDIYVALPAMFTNASGIETAQLCMKLKKSLYGMRVAPKLWND
jgi:Reverse transcriptase (RNA-dependent DNA polymerase)